MKLHLYMHEINIALFAIGVPVLLSQECGEIPQESHKNEIDVSLD